MSLRNRVTGFSGNNRENENYLMRNNDSMEQFVKKHFHIPVSESSNETLPTNAFGEIEFSGKESTTNAKYIRCAPDTKPSHIYELMIKHWKMEIPNLLISVTGGAQNFTMKPRLREVFRKSLVKAAESTGAWITTGGTHCGVMKHVGTAVKNHASIKSNSEKVVTLGVATWGAVSNRKDLQIDDQEEVDIVSYEAIANDGIGLDPNHSHFILVDDGSVGKFGREIELRTSLESHISKEGGRKNKRILLVCMIVQGGPGSLKTVTESLRNNTPCVVVGGSGQWANILAELNTMSIQESDVTEQLIGELMKENDAGVPEHSKLVSLTSDARECVRLKHLITVFEISPAGTSFDLDIAILSALLTATENGQHSVKQQLSLAMAWNRCDAARSLILTDDVTISKKQLAELFLESLLENKPEFAKLFIENEVPMNHRVVSEGFDNLLEKLRSNDLIKKLINNPRHGENKIARCVRKLIGKPYVKTHTTIPKPVVKSHQHKQFVEKKMRKKEYSPIKTLQLFQWAVLANYMELARILWEHLRDAIPAAIGAHAMLRKMAKQTQSREKKQELKKCALVYENLAIGVLTKCFDDNTERTGELLIYKLDDWCGETCLHMAVASKAKYFVSQPGVQFLLNKVWMGSLHDDTYAVKIIMAGICPLLLTTKFIKFQKNVVLDETHLNENNVNNVDSEHSGSRMIETELPNDNLSNTPIKTPHDINSEQEHLSQVGTPKCSNPLMKMVKKVVSFYNAPVVTFWMNFVSYVLFLVLFAYVSLSNYFPVTPSVFEIVLVCWVSTFLFEEIRQFFHEDTKLLREKAQRYFADFWNWMDLAAILTFYLSLGLRFTSSLFTPAHIILAISFMLYCVRIMHIFAVHKVLGPKIIMVGKMFKDLIFFLFILVVFLIAYGVASQSILYPNEWRFNKVVIGVAYKAYWQIYGELFLDELNYNPAIDAFTCSNDRAQVDLGVPRCPENEWIVPILSAIYLIVANVLLLNLLIAMFSSTFEKVQSNTDIIWKFQQHSLIEDYYFRPALAPPLIVFSHFYLLCKYFINSWRSTHEKEHDLQIILQQGSINTLMKWERWHVEAYVQETHILEAESMENKIKGISERVDTLLSSLESIQSNMNKHHSTLHLQKHSSGSLP